MRITKKLLKELYIKQNLSKKQVAKFLQISNGKLTELLRYYRLAKSKEQIYKNISESLKGHQTFNLQQGKRFSEKQIIDLYIKEGMNIRSVARRLNCSVSTIERLITIYNIEKPQRLINRDTMKYNRLMYGVDYPIQLGFVKKKIAESMRRNNSYGKSKEEEYIAEKLIERFGQENVRRQYNLDNRYPFKCDFYIPSLDLFIEYQGSQFHNKQPFNPLNPKHLKLAAFYKHKGRDRNSQYARMFYVWCKYDPLKRKYAKENKLNYLEFFTVRDFERWYYEEI